MRRVPYPWQDVGDPVQGQGEIRNPITGEVMSPNPKPVNPD